MNDSRLGSDNQKGRTITDLCATPACIYRTEDVAAALLRSRPFAAPGATSRPMMKTESNLDFDSDVLRDGNSAA